MRSDGLGNVFAQVAPEDDAVEGVLGHQHLVNVKESEQVVQQNLTATRRMIASAQLTPQALDVCDGRREEYIKGREERFSIASSVQYDCVSGHKTMVGVFSDIILDADQNIVFN